jgi:hypothetical protein
MLPKPLRRHVRFPLSHVSLRVQHLPVQVRRFNPVRVNAAQLRHAAASQVERGETAGAAEPDHDHPCPLQRHKELPRAGLRRPGHPLEQGTRPGIPDLVGHGDPRRDWRPGVDDVPAADQLLQIAPNGIWVRAREPGGDLGDDLVGGGVAVHRVQQRPNPAVRVADVGGDPGHGTSDSHPAARQPEWGVRRFDHRTRNGTRCHARWRVPL